MSEETDITEETPAGAAAFLAVLKDTAEHHFTTKGRVPPLGFMICRRDQDGKRYPEPAAVGIGIDPSFMEDAESKERLLLKMRGMAFKTEAYAWAILHEVWWTYAPDPDERARLNRTGLSELPDRREAVIVSLEHAHLPARRRVAMATIVRPTDGSKPLLEPWIEDDASDDTYRFGQSVLPSPPAELPDGYLDKGHALAAALSPEQRKFHFHRAIDRYLDEHKVDPSVRDDLRARMVAEFEERGLL